MASACPTRSHPKSPPGTSPPPAADAGPFTGKGWTEQRKWLQDAKKAPPKKVTPARVDQIVQQARRTAEHGPWVDQLDRVMTQGEYRYVNDHWDTLPGNTNFVDALLDLKK